MTLEDLKGGGELKVHLRPLVWLLHKDPKEAGEGLAVGLGVDPGRHVAVEVVDIGAVGDELVHAIPERLEDALQASMDPLEAAQAGGVADDKKRAVRFVSKVEDVARVPQDGGGGVKEDP